MDYQQTLFALADPSRLEIIDQLRDGPASVGEIAANMTIGRSAVSQHLKILKDASLVVDEAKGTQRIYDLNRRAIHQLRNWLDSF